MEEWKPVNGFEGYYEVSSIGKVKALDRVIFDKNGFKKHHKERILKQQLSNRGYKKVSLTKDCIKKTFFIHRLVALSFIENENNLPTINHINEIKTDNRVENLEWMTFEDNATYGTAQIRAHEALKNGPCSKVVHQYTLDGKFVKSYPSVSEAGRTTQFCPKKISAVAVGNRKTHKGYFFSYSLLKACSGVKYA